MEYMVNHKKLLNIWKILKLKARRHKLNSYGKSFLSLKIEGSNGKVAWIDTSFLIKKESLMQYLSL